MSRTTKIIGFSVPPAVVREVATMAREERRTRSELFREMVRLYHRYRQQRDRDEDLWIMNLIEETKAGQVNSPMNVDEMLVESGRLAGYGKKQAKKLGIKPKDVNRLIHAYRKTRKA